MPQETPPPELDSFLKNHESEISEIYRTKNITGSWKKLGAGVSKTAYTHPDMDFIIKIPHGQSHWGYSDSDVTIHYKHLKEAENLVQKNSYDRLTIPEAYLIQNSEGPLVVEKKLDVERSSLNAFLNKDKKVTTIALAQFKRFMEKSGHCDIIPLLDHNAAFLKNEEASIGIFDFDCKTNSDYINILNAFLEKTSIIISAEQTAKHIIGSEYKTVASTLGVAAGIASIVYCNSEYIPIAIDFLKETILSGVLLGGAAAGAIIASEKIFTASILKCKSLFGRCWKPDTSEVLELTLPT
jgi:hypothetical protein